MAADRYEVRTSSHPEASHLCAIVDRHTMTIEREYPISDLPEAHAYCASMNVAEHRFQASGHTAEAFAAQWRNTVKGAWPIDNT